MLKPGGLSAITGAFKRETGGSESGGGRGEVTTEQEVAEE